MGTDGDGMTATPDARITALENVLYGAVTSSDEEYDAHVAGQAALASLAAELAQAKEVIAMLQKTEKAELAAIRQALELIARGDVVEAEVIARAVLAGTHKSDSRDDV